MGSLYYNLETNQAFRVNNEFGGKTWCKNVKENCGRAKMGASFYPIPTGELSQGIESGKIVKLYSEKTIARDIQFIRCGLPVPKQEKIKAPKRKVQSVHTFTVGSLIDKNPSDYVAICCAMTGEIIGHEYNGKQFKHEAEAVELIQEIQNENQLNLF